MKLRPALAPIAALIATSLLHAAGEPEMRPLFNGKDLTGWSGEGYVVEDGAIVCTPQGRNLMTVETFANYILDFEFKLPPGGNNGLGIHYPGQGDSAYSGMELQILDNSHPKYADLKDYQFHGSLYTLAPAARTGLKPVGEWNHQRVHVMGPAIKVELNGQIILRANLDDLNQRFPDHQGAKRRSGHLGWLGHGDRVAFRNIHILELPPTANTEGVKAAGFTQIFDGKSLAGWKTGPNPPTNWFVHNGILQHTGKKGDINDLWSEKTYQNFTLVFDWRWSDRGPLMQRPVIQPDGTEKKNADGSPVTVEVEELDSGIYLRGSTKAQVNLWNWPAGSGEVYGFRTAPDSSPEVRAAVTPHSRADNPPGQWNRMMISLRNEVLNVSLNGRVVIENAKLPGIPATGPIGLQHHGAAIDFANIWIKEE